MKINDHYFYVHTRVFGRYAGCVIFIEEDINHVKKYTEKKKKKWNEELKQIISLTMFQNRHVERPIYT